MKRLWRRLLVGLGALFILAAVAISVDGMTDRIVDTDLAIVPGNAVNRDGRPSRRLRGRLDAALALYRAGHCKAILVSGGVGDEGFDEAEVMKRYLVQQGVASASIFTDSHGVNTFETARFAAELIRAKGFGDPILVSQFFHLSRLRLALAKHGVRAAGQVHSRSYEIRDLYSVFREVIGYGGYLGYSVSR